MALNRYLAAGAAALLLSTTQGCLLPTRPWPPDASRDVVDVHRVRTNQVMLDGSVGETGEDVVIPTDGPVGPTVRFHTPTAAGPVPFASVPYPSDLYLDATGHISIAALPVGAA